MRLAQSSLQVHTSRMNCFRSSSEPRAAGLEVMLLLFAAHVELEPQDLRGCPQLIQKGLTIPDVPLLDPKMSIPEVGEPLMARSR